MTFKYSLVSDLHLDFGGQPKIPPLEEFVIVAGDTSNGLGGLKYLDKLKSRGHKVFAVDGNHEHYANASQGRSLRQTEGSFYEHLKQDGIHDLPEHQLRIIGVNGWYHVEDERHWAGYMNDCKRGNLCQKDVNLRAEDHAWYIQRRIAEMPVGWKSIVVTHTSPHPMSLDPRYRGSDGNQYFFNPWMERVMDRHQDRIAVWHHGHTHRGCDIVVDGVRIVTNPRGYPGENPDWKPLAMEVSL